MTNLFLFLAFFLLVSLIFDFFCVSFMDAEKKGVLPLTPKSFVYLSLIVLIPALLVAFRSESTGVDTPAYLKMFSQNHAEEILLYRMRSTFEFLYWGICYLFLRLDNVRGAFFVFSFLSLFASFFAIYRISPRYNPFIVSFLFLLLFYQECFNAMRQMNAIAFVLLAYTFVLTRRILPFFICIVVASQFHSTAIFAMPLYFLYPSKMLTSWNYAKRIFFMVVIIASVSFFLDIFFSLNFATKYLIYKETMQQVSVGQSLLNFIVMYLPLVCFIFFFSLEKKFESITDKNEFDFLWSTIIVFCALILLRFVQNWFFRLGFYYQLSEILFIGKLCQKNLRNEKTLLNYNFAASDFLVLFSILSFLLWNYLYFNQSALVNFSLM